VANATNRVAVAVQCLAAVAGFDGWGRRRPRAAPGSSAASGIETRLPWAVVARTVAPATLGSLVGALAASFVSDDIFRPILGAVLLLMAGVVLIRPERWLQPADAEPRKMDVGLTAAFFFAGLYGGFIQAGVGFMLLAALVPGMGLDLVRANGVKVALVLVLTLVALGVFVAGGLVDWRAGAVLAVGNGTGGYIGARMAIRLGAKWIRWVLVVMVCISALEILGAREALLRLWSAG
jgi:uncharacterized protein